MCLFTTCTWQFSQYINQARTAYGSCFRPKINPQTSITLLANNATTASFFWRQYAMLFQLSLHYLVEALCIISHDISHCICSNWCQNSWSRPVWIQTRWKRLHQSITVQMTSPSSPLSNISYLIHCFKHREHLAVIRLTVSSVHSVWWPRCSSVALNIWNTDQLIYEMTGETSSSRRGVRRLRSSAVYIGTCLRTAAREYSWTAWSLQMVRIGCPKGRWRTTNIRCVTSQKSEGDTIAYNNKGTAPRLNTDCIHNFASRKVTYKFSLSFSRHKGEINVHDDQVKMSWWENWNFLVPMTSLLRNTHRCIS
jgi:hypothetical protein